MSRQTHFITKGLLYSVPRASFNGSILAEDIPSDWDAKQHHIYCEDCYEKRHHPCRLKPMPEDKKRGLPKRFERVDQSSFHRCDDRLRYRDIESHVARYGGEKIGPHAFRFPFASPHPDLNYKTDFESRVHRAERVAKLAYATMYDPELLMRQRAQIDGVDVPLGQAITDHSDLKSLYGRLAADSAADMVFAGIVLANGNRGVWAPLSSENIIPGHPGRQIKYCGRDFRTAVHLKCANREIYNGIKKKADDYGFDKSAAFVVFAKARLDIDRMNWALERGHRGEKKVRYVAAIECDIHHSLQAHFWPYARTFQEAVEAQATHPPIFKRTKQTNPNSEQMELAL